jgi:ABC-type multidrug transport system ATPase subunit
MKRISLAEVSRVYGRSFALHRVDLEFEAGTSTLLLGGNGAGKTTLINILATLDKPSNGEVSYDGRSWEVMAKHGREQIGWVSHDSLVYPELTGRENLNFYANMYGVEDGDAITSRWLERVGLTDAGDKRVMSYSRGMRQRLSIARALIHAPRLVLLDEPLTGLDRDGRKLMLDMFAKLRDQGCILVMITHDLGIDHPLVDRIAVLKRGKLAYAGDASEDMNLLEAYRQHG